MQQAILLASLTSLHGCDLGKGGGGSSPPMEGPPKPTYERTFDEFADVPKQITAQVEWAAKPIDDAIVLADEIAALRAKLNVDPATFASMCKVAFKDGKIEIGAQTELQAAKAEIEATLAKIKQVGTDLQGLPARVKTATKNISSLAMATPKLALKSTQELTGELKVAVGDGAVQIQADLDTVKALPDEVKAQAIAAKDVLAQLPTKAEASTRNLLAAMAGEPIEKQEPTAGGGGTAEAGTDPAATTTTAGSTTTGSTTGSTTAAASGTVPTPPSGSVTPPPTTVTAPTTTAPASIVTARVKTLQSEATAAGNRGDWLSAADAYEEAYLLTPTNQMLAFKIGEAAIKAKDCTRGQSYYERFLQTGDPNANAEEQLAAKKAIGELKTFGCPARTPEDIAALAETLSIEAEALGQDGDWGGAALMYANAYQIAPEQHELAFGVAVASWKSHECGDAMSYFEHFKKVGDPKAHRKQLREVTRYEEEAEAGMCQPLSTEEKNELARELYGQAQSLEQALDFLGAAGKYERAYALLPSNHAFAFRIAESYWGAQRCELAEPHFRSFASFATDPVYAEDLTKTKDILARIDGHGCPNALWNTAVATGSSGGGSTTSGGSELPPESGGGGGGAANCSVAADGHRGGMALGLLMLLVGALRRRRE